MKQNKITQTNEPNTKPTKSVRQAAYFDQEIRDIGSDNSSFKSTVETFNKASEANGELFGDVFGSY